MELSSNTLHDPRPGHDWWLKDVGGILAGGLLLFHVRSKGCLAVVLLNILVSVLNKWS